MPFSLLLVLIFIVFSWLSIRLIEKRNIFWSWLTPASQRFREFILGFFWMAMLCILSQLFFSVINDINWSISDEITTSKFIYATASDVNSVLFEELLFRGVLLYGFIAFATQQKGILISAAAFGVYHWFTFGVFGNMLGMILVFITTGFMGYVFAEAYARTSSLVLPFGLHLGWNWVNNSMFSNGPDGTVLLVPDHTAQLEGYLVIISFAWYVLVPAVTLIFLRRGLFDRLRKRALTNPAT